MPVIHACVRQSDDDAVALGDAMNGSDVKELKVPLAVANGVGLGTRRETNHRRCDRCEEHDRVCRKAMLGVQRSMPITPGPTSWRRSGGGSITRATPSATVHGLSGSPAMGDCRRLTYSSYWRSRQPPAIPGVSGAPPP